MFYSMSVAKHGFSCKPLAIYFIDFGFVHVTFRPDCQKFVLNGDRLLNDALHPLYGAILMNNLSIYLSNKD